MGQLVKPKTYMVGFTVMNEPEVLRYLQNTGQMAFWEDVQNAVAGGISTGEALCSLFAKLCYKSLVPDRNANVTKTREIGPNLRGCFDTGHGSVFEHCQLNFLTTNCSRIVTHELVRHRAGTAFSQTSGRFCRLDSIDLVWDPILDPVSSIFGDAMKTVEDAVYLAECRLGLRKPPSLAGSEYASWQEAVSRDPMFGSTTVSSAVRAVYRWVPDMSFDMDKRKAITSAIRRIAPNGQANEIGWSVNIRSLRHIIMVRTAPKAEYEIRLVANQAYDLAKEKFPLLFYAARERMVDGQRAVTGMKLHPFEVSTDYLASDEEKLCEFDSGELRNELSRRHAEEVAASANADSIN